MEQLSSIAKGVIYELWVNFKKPLIFFMAIFVSFVILTPIFIYGYFAKDLVSKDTIINNHNKGIALYDRNNQLFFNFYEAKDKTIVSLEDVPKYLQDAIISVEDKDFYNHPGFSFRAIIRAFYTNLINQDILHGASTITQQLVKNSLLNPEKTFFRKYQEIVLAFEIERLYSKKEILEMYLNTVYFGENATGVGSAAKAYFSKNVKDLNLAESALLAAILPAPSRYSPISGDRKEALKLQKRVLEKMAEQNYISVNEKSAAEKQNIFLTPTNTIINTKAVHFALMVRDELLGRYSEQELAASGFKVITTIDLDWQDFAEKTVQEEVQKLTPNKASNGSAVVIDPKTSEVLALVGSIDWHNKEFGKLNMATAPRQPGSAFKPVIYAKAFEDGLITTDTVLKDLPTNFENNYKPQNYDKRFRGPLLPRRALANSINVPSVEVMQKVGINNALDFAKRMGITTLKDPSNYGLSLVLGTGEVSLLELTNAYAAFANNGIRHSPTIIKTVENKTGKIIYNPTLSSQKVLENYVTFIISSILSDNIARAEVFGNTLTINRPAAVKTGTTENYRDALTIGYTPSLVIGVWVGNSDNRPMDSVAGSLGAAPIWRALMTEFLKDTPIEKFNPPSTIETVYICKNNGLKARSATSSAYREYFLPGTEPAGFCDAPTPTINPSL